MKHRQNIVLLLAGGIGKRMHNETPKQFVKILNKPVFIHALLPFERHNEIEEIYVVCTPNWEKFVVEMAKEHGITKFRGTFHAGKESIDSLRNGIEGIRQIHPDKNPTIITHEGVRPLISHDIISENLKVYAANGNAISATIGNEAFLISDDGVSSTECRPRENCFLAQMPQTFSLQTLELLFAEAKRKNIEKAQSLYTLHAEVFPEKNIFIAKSRLANIKITQPEDMDMARALLSSTSTCRFE